MLLLDKIIVEVSDQECVDSRQADTPPQFVANKSETKVKDRSTYTQVYLSDCAVHMTGVAMTARGIIDHGELGGICVSSLRRAGEVTSNTFVPHMNT